MTVTDVQRNTYMSDEQLLEILEPSMGEKIYKFLAFLSPVLILLLWEVLSRAGALDTRFFPAPTEILVFAKDAFFYGDIIPQTLITLYRVAVGFLMGTIPALLLGIVLGVMPRARRFFMPIFKALYPVPKIAILPLLLLIFGLGDMAKFVAIAISVFFLVFFNVVSGVINIPKIYYDVARNSTASRFQTFLTVSAPGAIPSIFTGLRLAVANAFIVVTAVEFVASNDGIGYVIWNSWQTFSIESMYIGIVLISLLGYLATLLVDLVERVIAPWSAS